MTIQLKKKKKHCNRNIKSRHRPNSCLCFCRVVAFNYRGIWQVYILSADQKQTRLQSCSSATLFISKMKVALSHLCSSVSCAFISCYMWVILSYVQQLTPPHPPVNSLYCRFTSIWIHMNVERKDHAGLALTSVYE